MEPRDPVAEAPDNDLVVRVRGLVNRFGSQVVHDGLVVRGPAQRDHGHRRRLRSGQVGTASHHPRPARAAGGNRRGLRPEHPRALAGRAPRHVARLRRHVPERRADLLAVASRRTSSCRCAKPIRCRKSVLDELVQLNLSLVGLAPGRRREISRAALRRHGQARGARARTRASSRSFCSSTSRPRDSTRFPRRTSMRYCCTFTPSSSSRWS